MCNTDSFPVDDRYVSVFGGLRCPTAARPSVVVRDRFFLLEKVGPLGGGRGGYV